MKNPFKRQLKMDLDTVLSNYSDGGGVGWTEEFTWLLTHDGEYMGNLIRSIRLRGIREPVLLGEDGRIWDGHHRLCIAWLLGIKRVPVAHSEGVK